MGLEPGDIFAASSRALKIILSLLLFLCRDFTIRADVGRVTIALSRLCSMHMVKK
jgi:hypothetical protein